MVQQEFRFASDHEEVHSLKEYLNPLLRSIVRNNEYMLLDGDWRFELDLADKGLHDRWYLGHQFAGHENSGL